MLLAMSEKWGEREGLEAHLPQKSQSFLGGDHGKMRMLEMIQRITVEQEVAMGKEDGRKEWFWSSSNESRKGRGPIKIIKNKNASRQTTELADSYGLQREPRNLESKEASRWRHASRLLRLPFGLTDFVFWR